MEYYVFSTSNKRIPLLAFNPTPDSTGKTDADTDEHHDDFEGGNRIICQTCGQTITWQKARMAVFDKWNHVFFNPHGLVFEIGCFAIAPGCLVLGTPTEDFTWFSGHAWQQAACGGCGVHLGWQFTATDGSGSFFGLILDQLADDESPDT